MVGRRKLPDRLHGPERFMFYEFDFTRTLMISLSLELARTPAHTVPKQLGP
jgi:hypothetical protein